MVLPAHAEQAVQVTLKCVRNEGNFTLEVGTIFRHTSPRIAVGSLSNKICYSRPMR
jgi:hypothetical protein